FFFFFFQAEDGIRDSSVTGVQTCALPIFHMFSGDDWRYSIGDLLVTLSLVLLFIEIVKSTRTSSRQIVNHGLSMLTFVVALVERSEERRVGKEGRCRLWREHEREDRAWRT